MPTTGSKQEGQIGQKEFFAARFGLNALHRYPRRFDVVCRLEELDDVLKPHGGMKRLKLSWQARANSFGAREAKPVYPGQVGKIACATPSALVSATAPILLILDNACSSAWTIGSVSESGAAVPGPLGT